MAKYIRSLNKSDSRFSVSDEPEENKQNVLESAIGDAKQVRKDALKNAQEMLKSGKSQSYREIGTCGTLDKEFIPIRGTCGVAGTIGTMGSSGVSGQIGQTAISGAAYIPEYNVKYNREDNTYTINGKKYTEELINDINAFHSINPIELLSERSSNKQGGSVLKVRDSDDVKCYGTASWFGEFDDVPSPTVTNIINEDGRRRLMKLVGITPNDEVKEKKDIAVDNIKKQILDAFTRRNNNWKFKEDNY